MVREMMTVHRFDGSAIPGQIISGPGTRARLAEEVAALGLKRVLVVSGPRIRADTPWVTEVETLLGDRLAGVFGRVEQHSPDRSLREAAEYARPLAPDAVLSVGGGSAHDAAKAIAVAVPGRHTIADFASRFEPPDTFHRPEVDAEPLAVLTMPTTFSAAEVVGGGAFTDRATGRKLIFVHPRLTPKLVVLDGEMVASTPRSVLAASGMNALHHCLEALYSKGAQPITDAFALRAFAGLIATLPALAPKAPTPGIDVLQRALDASAMSGLTYANSWLGIGHAVCHVLGGRYGLSHGESNAVMIRHSLRFNLEHAREPLALAAHAAGASFPAGQTELACRHVVALVDWLAQKLDTPQRLRDLALPKDQFRTIAEDVMADPQTYWNPRPVARDDVVALLEEAW
jgi:alcohol dehydrogenase class IV